jgi:hypothetical protein
MAATAKPLARNGRPLIVGAALLLLATLLAALSGRAQDTDAAAATTADGKKEPPPPPPAVYEVPEGARDPFFPVAPEEPTPEEKAVEEHRSQEETRAQRIQAELPAQVRLEAVFTGPGNTNLALLNQAIVKSGDQITVSVAGETLTLTVVEIQAEPPGVKLRWQEFELVRSIDDPSGEKP